MGGMKQRAGVRSRKMRLRRSKLFEEFIEAQERLIAAAISGSEEVFMHRLDDPTLTGAEMRNYLYGFQALVLSGALIGLLGHYPNPTMSAELLSDMAAWRRPTMSRFDAKVARLLLRVDMMAEVGIPDGSDHIQYVGRVMPTVTLITAYAFSHSSGEAKRWRSRLRDTAALYERKAGKKLARGGLPVKC
ncbi:MAG: hypothetical protein JWN95_1797 [Frankiales bacterium]|nr:hypothetical protein [Frankiales bacterium]